MNFNSLSGATVKWTVDRDSIIRSVEAMPGGGGIFSQDPSLTYAGYVQTSDSVDENFLLYVENVAKNISGNLSIPIFKGQEIYFASKTTFSTCQMMIDDA